MATKSFAPKFLGTTGLSMSQAQSISNLCNQNAEEIKRQLSRINNYSMEIKFPMETIVTKNGHPIPDNLIAQLKEIGQLHACQAYLMSAIKSKEKYMELIRWNRFEYDVPQPAKRLSCIPTSHSLVNENWGWEQLTDAEHAEYLEAESMASHLGQFIHKAGILDSLRKELPKLSPISWITIKDGEKTPERLLIHHTEDDLMMIHEAIAKQHAEFEQKVNYFKAKVKNLVSEENNRIAKVNAAEMRRAGQETVEYNQLLNQWSTAKNAAESEFDASKEKQLNEASKLRIQVDPRFQPLVNRFNYKEPK